MLNRKICNFIAGILCCALVLTISVPAFADTTQSLPSNVVLYEGETWIPPSELTPFHSVLRESENSDCGKTDHLAPKGYRYVGCVKGDSVVDSFIAGVSATIIGFVPGIGTITTIISLGLATEGLLNYLEEGRVRTTYYKYIWQSGNQTWTHIIWTYPDSTGEKYLTCEVCWT